MIWETPEVTLTLLDNYKVEAKYKDIVEIYNLSYKNSTKTPNYLSYIEFVDEDGVYYYLNIISQKDTGKIKYKGDYISNGWYSDKDQEGSSYSLHSAHFTRNITNGWYFGFALENRLGKYPLSNAMLDEAIQRVNAAFPRAHMSRSTKTETNYITMDDYDDTWLALCSSSSTSVNIKFNYRTLVPDYGQYTEVKTSSSHKKWVGTAVHEMGHTFGCPDQASHLPSIYDYSRDRTKALYLQANDIAWLKHAYKNQGCDPSIFDIPATNGDMPSAASQPALAAEQPRMMKAAARTLSLAPNDNDEEELVLNFDFSDFDSTQDLENASSNIVTATLTFDKTEKLNIGGDLELTYNIYTINVIDEEKGNLVNKKLKVHPQEDRVEENKIYRLYLQSYEKTPCSLMNVKTGLVEI